MIMTKVALHARSDMPPLQSTDLYVCRTHFTLHYFSANEFISCNFLSWVNVIFPKQFRQSHNHEQQKNVFCTTAAREAAQLNELTAWPL